MPDGQQNPMIAGIEAFIQKHFDVNNDGAVDHKDLSAAMTKAGEFVYHFLSGVVASVAPELPGLALQAATAALTTTGDKRKAALGGIVQTLADDTVHAAVAQGTDEAVAIGEHYGIPGTTVSALVGAAYDTAKAKHQIR